MMAAETQPSETHSPAIRTNIDRVERLDARDLQDLCEATDMAILDGSAARSAVVCATLSRM